MSSEMRFKLPQGGGVGGADGGLGGALYNITQDFTMKLPARGVIWYRSQWQTLSAPDSTSSWTSASRKVKSRSACAVAGIFEDEAR